MMIRQTEPRFSPQPMMNSCFSFRILFTALLSLCLGCSARSEYLRPDLARNDCFETPETYVDNSPHPHVDRIENTLEWIPNKIGVGRSLVERDEIPPETLSLLNAYMEEHGLGDIPIVIDEYSPSGYWKRVQKARTISTGWRYVGGGLGWLKSSLIPGRSLDRNYYDPASNTLYANSNNPIDLLSELAYARQLREKSWRGTRMAFRTVKVVNQFARIEAGREAWLYASEQDLHELEKQGLRNLYTEYAMLPALAAGAFLPWYANPLLRVAARTTGTTLANRTLSRRETERGIQSADRPSPQESQPEAEETFVQSLVEDPSSENVAVPPQRLRLSGSSSSPNSRMPPVQVDRIETDDDSP